MTPGFSIRTPSRATAFKIGVAVALTWLLFGGYILVSVLGVNLSPLVLAILVGSSFIVFYSIADRLYKNIDRYYEAIDALDLDLEDLEGVDLDEDESPFLVWMLLNRITSSITSSKVNLVLYIAEDGIPVAVYPQADSEFTGILEPGNEIRVDAKGSQVTVILPLDDYLSLKELIEKRDGEVVEIQDQRELALIYRVAYALAKELNKGADPTIIHYIAYKAIVKLAKRKAILLPEKTLYNIPELDPDTRKRILDQLREEKLL